MVQKKWVSMLYREIRGLHEAAYLLGVFAVLSQLLALVRDRMFAHTFGASTTLDLYYAAFRIPDFMYAAIASLVSVYVLIPLLENRMQDSHAQTRAFIDGMFTFFSVAMVSASTLLFFTAPYLLAYLFPTFDPPAAHELVLLTRIMLLQPILLGVSNLFASIAQTYHRFVLFAVTPLLYNLGIIFGVLVLYPLFGAPGLACGVVLGALLHLSVQIPFVYGEALLPRPTLHPNWGEIKKVLFISLPRTLTLSAQQITMLFLAAFASLFSVGSISVFTLGFNLQSVPLSIIGVSYSVAAFPTLARLYSSGEREKFFIHIITAAKHIIFWSLPATALFIVLRAQIVRVVLGSGAFNWNATRLTAAALALFTLSLVAQALVFLFVRGYYAAGKTRKPLFINLFSSLLSILCAYGFSYAFVHIPSWSLFFGTVLRVSDLPGTAVLMLPLGYSIGVMVNALLLLYMFQRDFSTRTNVLLGVLWKSGLAALVTGTGAYVGLFLLTSFFSEQTFFGVLGRGFFAGVLGIALGMAALLLTKSDEFKEVMTAFHSRFWKRRVVVSE